jgi:hypothetical protein
MAGRRNLGELPESEWPKVLHRYLAGERASAIARDFGCSGALVSSVVRRNLLYFGELTAGLFTPSDRLLGLDPALNSRLAGAMIRFLETFDAARRKADEAAIDDLRQSSDHLVRAIARMRIELERRSHESN